MTKRFFLAALTAVALSLGFTACSEDENNPVQDGYTLTVNVHVDAMGSDIEEVVTINNAYRTAFGLLEMDKDTTTNECVSITGKDSMECVKSIQKRCAQAETALYGTTWTDENIISIRDITTNAAIYTKKYGSAAENGESINCGKFNKAHGSLFKLENIPDNFYVYDVRIDSRSKMISPYTDFWCQNWVGPDLNKKAGGNYVYPSYDGHVNDYIVQPRNYVGGMLVLVNESGKNPPKTFVYDGNTYKIAVDENTLDYSFDLNHKAGGPYLYLYYTTAERTKKVLRGDLSHVYWSYENFYKKSDNYVRGVTYRSDGSITMTHPDGINLNEGAGGFYMYWEEIYDTPWD